MTKFKIEFEKLVLMHNVVRCDFRLVALSDQGKMISQKKKKQVILITLFM
jgi:hypothetical protein